MTIFQFRCWWDYRLHFLFNIKNEFFSARLYNLYIRQLEKSEKMVYSTKIMLKNTIEGK